MRFLSDVDDRCIYPVYTYDVMTQALKEVALHASADAEFPHKGKLEANLML